MQRAPALSKAVTPNSGDYSPKVKLVISPDQCSM